MIVKPTDFQADQLLFQAFSPGGVSLAPDSLLMSARFASQLVGISGVGEFSAVDLGKKLAGKAVRYRTEQYGHFPGFGRPEWNPHPPMHYARRVDFFGRRTRLHERILPAVACAEAEIRRTCGAFPYQPRRLSGIRDRNTYHNGEVSNHVYGIALDVEPFHPAPS